MGPHQSKEDKHCREKMRQKVIEARQKKKEAAKADFEVNVIEVDKIRHKQSGQGANLSDQDKRKEAIEIGQSLTLNQESAIMLVAQAHQDDEEEKKVVDPYSSDPKDDRKSSGESHIYHVVDDEKEPIEDSQELQLKQVLLHSAQTDQVCRKQSLGYHSAASDDDEEREDLIESMETLKMTRASMVSASNTSGGRTGSQSTIDNKRSSFSSNKTSSFNIEGKKRNKHSRRTNLGANQETQQSCNTGCMFLSSGASSKGKGVSSSNKQSTLSASTATGISKKVDILTKKEKLQKIVQKEARSRYDDFEKVHLDKLQKKQEKKLQRMNLPIEQIETILGTKERCCTQCTSPVPLLCWRYKLQFSLEQGRLPDLTAAVPAGNAEEEGEPVSPKKTKAALKRQEFAQFYILDAWRETLAEFIQNDSGSYSTSDKPWLRAFYEYEVYQSKMLASKQKGLSTVHQLSRDAMLRQSHEISLNIEKDRRLVSIETGQSVLMCDEKVHDLVLFINKELSRKTHPIRITLDKFKVLFQSAHMVLLCRQTDITEIEIDEPFVNVPMEEKLDYAEYMLNQAINMFVEAILMFYELDDQVRTFDRTYDLFQNLVSNLIFEGEIYFLMFNLISSWLEPQQRALRRIMFSRETLENSLPIGSLTPLPQFQFDVNHRNLYTREDRMVEQPYYSSKEQQQAQSTPSDEKGTNSTQRTSNLASSGGVSNVIKIVGGVGDTNKRQLASSEDKKTKMFHETNAEDLVPYVYKGQPYSLAIRDLQKLCQLESPMSKLEWIYNCCTRQVSKEVDNFWKDYKIPTKKLFIDPDNLQGIIIFIVSRLKNPQIITEIHFIKKFVPKGIKRLGRFYHCEMVGAACSYLLEIESKNSEDLRTTEVTQNRRRRHRGSSNNLEPCYDTKQKRQSKGIGLQSFKNGRENSSEKSGSANEDEDDPTIRDDVSWNELAFGQSMRGSQSGSFVEQSQRSGRVKRPIIPQRISGVLGREVDAYENKTGVMSPTFASFAQPAAAGEKAVVENEDQVTVQWVDGTEEELRQKKDREGGEEVVPSAAKNAQEVDHGQPQVVVIMENKGSDEEANDDDDDDSFSKTQRPSNALLATINRHRNQKYFKIEQSQSQYFKRKVACSVLDMDQRKTTRQEAAAAGEDSNMYDDAFGDVVDNDFDRSRSVIELEDNFFFKNNRVLESDIRRRLGEATAEEMARASKKGYDRARCISEL